jgi:predicted AlkP superfamily pyrophosphatase or phosphodiesterase
MIENQARRGLWSISAAILILIAFCAGSARSAFGASNDRIVVLISIDGLANFYFEDPKAEMPTIRRLAAEGVLADGMKASMPSVTWPNHTSLVTGEWPARHGVVGNNYFDRSSGKVVPLIADPIYDKVDIVKVPTVYDLAKANGLKTLAIRWPASRNAPTLDWTVPDCNDPELITKCSTPELLDDCREAGLSLLNRQGQIDSRDENWTNIFNVMVKRRRPNLALLHIANLDHTEHIDGPRSPEAYEAINVADEQVRKVREVLEQEFPGHATLIIVSDHGFSPINKTILPNVVLRDAGLIKVSGSRVLDGTVRIVPQGGTAFVYVLDEVTREITAKRIINAFSDIEGIERVVPSADFAAYGVADPQRDPHAPDLLLLAKEGYSFGDTAAGQLPFSEKPERKGSHGHDTDLPNLRAVFVAWGTGIESGKKLGLISNTAVAPTIARLLGFEMANVEGEVPTDALAK